MGQKVNPIGLRVAVNKNWRSRWFSRKKGFGAMLNEDMKIRSIVAKRLENAAVSEVSNTNPEPDRFGNAAFGSAIPSVKANIIGN